jgi:hypothetical protein
MGVFGSLSGPQKWLIFDPILGPPFDPILTPLGPPFSWFRRLWFRVVPFGGHFGYPILGPPFWTPGGSGVPGDPILTPFWAC